MAACCCSSAPFHRVWISFIFNWRLLSSINGHSFTLSSVMKRLSKNSKIMSPIDVYTNHSPNYIRSALCDGNVRANCNRVHTENGTRTNPYQCIFNGLIKIKSRTHLILDPFSTYNLLKLIPVRIGTVIKSGKCDVGRARERFPYDEPSWLLTRVVMS